MGWDEGMRMGWGDEGWDKGLGIFSVIVFR